MEMSAEVAVPQGLVTQAAFKLHGPFPGHHASVLCSMDAYDWIRKRVGVLFPDICFGSKADLGSRSGYTDLNPTSDPPWVL